MRKFNQSGRGRNRPETRRQFDAMLDARAESVPDAYGFLNEGSESGDLYHRIKAIADRCNARNP